MLLDRSVFTKRLSEAAVAVCFVSFEKRCSILRHTSSPARPRMSHEPMLRCTMSAAIILPRTARICCTVRSNAGTKRPFGVLSACSTPSNLAASPAGFWRDKRIVNFTTMILTVYPKPLEHPGFVKFVRDKERPTFVCGDPSDLGCEASWLLGCFA
jgi:hypothetical protein